MSLVELSPEGRVARIRLNRPERLNALLPQLLRELVAVCEDLSAAEELGVVVLEGVGESFSAGADLPAFALEFESSPEETADLGRVAAEALASLPQITVASVRGHCVGGAVVLAAVCDLRIASADARFWIPELEAGIPLGWGGMAHLVRLVGETMAADVVCTARPFDAEEAQRAGFVSRVVAPEDLDDELARVVEAIAAKPRVPLRRTKAQLRAIRSGTYDPRGDAGAMLAAIADPGAGKVFRAYADRLT